MLEISGAISKGKARDEAKMNLLDALEVVPPDEELAGGSKAEDSESLTLTVAS